MKNVKLDDEVKFIDGPSKSVYLGVVSQVNKGPVVSVCVDLYSIDGIPSKPGRYKIALEKELTKIPRER